MGGGGKSAAGQVASAGIYTSGRIATNALTIGQAFLTAGAQIAAYKWSIDRQESMWDHVSAKQIRCVEVALDEFVSSLNSLLPTFKDAYPDVPVAARFVAVDPAITQFQQMVDNIQNTPKTQEYMAAANHWHRINYQARVELHSPGFITTFAVQMRQIKEMMNGQLPVDEAIAVTTDVAENAAMLGKIGNTRMLTAAAMGIRRLQLQKRARDEMGQRLQWIQLISPVESEVTLDELMLKPELRLKFALEQAQLLQNDLQNANNAAAQKAPHKMAELQAKLQRAILALSYGANKANMQNQFVPNFPAMFGPIISNLAKGITESFTWEKNPDSGQDLGGHLTPSSVTTVA